MPTNACASAIEKRRAQTAKAREAAAAKIASPDRRRAHFSKMAMASHARRLVMSGEDARRLVSLVEPSPALHDLMQKYPALARAAHDGVVAAGGTLATDGQFHPDAAA